MQVAVFEGYGMPRKGKKMAKRRGSSKLGRAAKACKGKKKGAFRACVRKKMRKGKR